MPWRPWWSGVANRKPATALQVNDSGLYFRSVSAGLDGELAGRPDYKSNRPFVVRFGWGRAILVGQAKVASGLEIGTPVLSMMSARSDLMITEWDETVKTVDMVLDVDHLAATSWRLGDFGDRSRFGWHARPDPVAASSA